MKRFFEEELSVAELRKIAKKIQQSNKSAALKTGITIIGMCGLVAIIVMLVVKWKEKQHCCCCDEFDEDDFDEDFDDDFEDGFDEDLDEDLDENKPCGCAECECYAEDKDFEKQ